MKNLVKKQYFNKFLTKIISKGLKYKIFNFFLKIFKFIFLIRKRYNFSLIDINYISVFDYQLQSNLPLFTRKKKKKIIVKALGNSKKIVEILKWIKVIINKIKFRKLNFRIIFLILNLYISNKYNIFKIIHSDIVKKIKFKKKKKKKKNSLSLLRLCKKC